MSRLQISATPVEFNETGFTMLIDGKPPPVPLPRYQVEVKKLSDVMHMVSAMKSELAAIDPAQFGTPGNLDHNPNGYMIYARIVEGRAPSGFKLIPRKAFEVRKVAA